MRLAFDAAAIALEPNRGIGNYATQLLGALVLGDPDNEYVFINYYNDFSLAELLGHPANLTEHHLFAGENNALLRDATLAPVLGDLLRNLVRNLRLDVFLLTHVFQEGYGYTPYRREWFGEAKVCAIVYDVIPYAMRGHYLKAKRARELYMERVEILRALDKCLAISQSTKADMVSLLGFDPDKIDVIYAGIGEDFVQTPISAPQAEAFLCKYGIRAPYLLGVLGDEYRKNMEGTIRAYAALAPGLRDAYPLVVVCRLLPEREAFFRQLARQLGVEDRVIFTNLVPQSDLPMLYQLAHLLLYPSRYEGFGLPVAEAWACGTPVLTGDNSSLREIAQGAAVLVDSADVTAIKNGLARALEQEDLPALLRQGQSRLPRFRWPAVAQAARASLLALAQAPRTPPAPARERMRIAFFTPLPPMQSGISDYSVDILRQLAGQFDIDVIIDDNYKPDCQLPDTVRVLSHKKFQPKLYGRILYQMGNSLFHAYMIYYIENYPGVLMMHDANLHELVSALCVHVNNYARYQLYLSYDYPPEQVEGYLHALRAGSSPVLISPMPVSGFVARYAQRILVHSRYAQESLLRNNIGYDVRQIPLYATIVPLADRAQAKTELGLDPDCTYIAAFGHIARAKRTVQIARAFVALSGQYPKARLLFVGKRGDDAIEEIQAVAREYHLEDRVTVTGFTPLDVFERYIDATDICLSLRYPENGETSGCLMRFLAKGKCVLVNEIGSFAELGDQMCVKLPSPETQSGEQEIACIRDALAALLQDEPKRRALEREARRYAEESLDIRKVALQYAFHLRDTERPSLDEDGLRALSEALSPARTTADRLALARTLAFAKRPFDLTGSEPLP